MLYWGKDKMIDKLKFLIDGCEDKPVLKKMLLQVAALPEEHQGPILDFIELRVKGEISEESLKNLIKVLEKTRRK